MRSMKLFLFGYLILLGGIVAALWKLGLLDGVGPAWLAIGLVIAIGLGVMVSVASGGSREMVEIDKQR